MRATPLWSWLLAALLFAPASALAQDEGEAEAAESEGEGEGQPDEGKPQTPPYMVKIQSGIRLIVQKDADGALAALREAVELESARPEAHYYMGTAHRQKDAKDEALKAFRTAAQRAEAAGRPRYHARALFAVASTLTRLASSTSVEKADDENVAGVNMAELEEAREAWQQVMAFAQGGQSLVNPEVVRSRIQALDQVIEQDRSYSDVRKKILQREQEEEEDEDGDE